MHHVLIIFTSTFIQGYRDVNPQNNNCLIISGTIQAMAIQFAVEIVQLKVYMAIAIPMNLTFIQGHKCISNLTTVLICNISDNISAIAFKRSTTVDL